jgi:hypothetical protein
LDKQTTKDEIIRFVMESTEEESRNIATFIAGMQAQKKIDGDKKGKIKALPLLSKKEQNLNPEKT